MSKKSSYSRGYSPRNIDTKEPKPRFLIVCEGTKTECNYFEAFRVPKNVVEVVVKGVGENPSKLVDSAKRINDDDDDEYDQIWCVFDRDDWSISDFNHAISAAEKQGFRVAYSNEAFELWYVLHFEFLNSGISRNDYIQKLRLLLGKEYRKNTVDMYDLLLDKQSIAIRNATKLLNQYSPHVPSKDNPSTTVHLLVQELNKFMA
jgi:RloB-like protein